MITSRARKVAVIGAGPSGLAAAKYLLAEQSFQEIILFEQRPDVGGLWNHTPCPRSVNKNLHVPQTNPHQGAEACIHDQSGSLDFLSPVYDKLETNIPRGLMGFSDLNWPKDCQLFPSHGAVLDYIKAYAQDVRHLVRLGTQVLDVRLKDDQCWSVTTKAVTMTGTAQVHEQTFDAVIVANGHFRVEYIPPMLGLEDWHVKHPDTIYHSKLYRRAEDFADKKVLIIGNSASGIDIGAQIRQVCRKPLIQSSRSQSYLQLETPPDQIERPEVKELIPASRTARFIDGSEESDIDVIMFCTGYMYNFPFLKSLKPQVVDTGEMVLHLYKHIFYQPRPTLSFMVLNQKVIPFPVAEAQAAVIARFLAGRLALPSRQEMEEWEEMHLSGTSRLRDFHLLKFPEDAKYINELHDWALQADAEVTQGNGSVNGTTPANRRVGKVPPFWSDEEYWTREKFPAIKKAFQSLGETRHSKTSLKDVGFDYNDWKAEQAS